MTKIMTFIDGSWTYANIPTLAMAQGIVDLHIDYGLLPKVLAEKVAAELQLSDVDIVRTYFFASIPVNYDERDEGTVQRRRDFYELLKEEFHYETELYPVNFRNRRLRRADRDPEDEFEPREKMVDIALASSLISYAAVPNAYDVAVLVIGDRDYVPALQTIRRMGKRVAIASIRDSCAFDYSDPRDAARVKDADIIWLNDIVSEVKLSFEPRWIECQSEFHEGDRKVWTSYRPRRHQPFYCDTCRSRFVMTVAEPTNGTIMGEPGDDMESANDQRDDLGLYSDVQLGKVYEIKPDRYYGFVRANNGKEYYFNASTLAGMVWMDVEIGMDIEFEVLREPTLGKAGAASVVRRVGD
jgi:uncharacterized LabA/DUF88 family protein